MPMQGIVELQHAAMGRWIDNAAWSPSSLLLLLYGPCVDLHVSQAAPGEKELFVPRMLTMFPLASICPLLSFLSKSYISFRRALTFVPLNNPGKQLCDSEPWLPSQNEKRAQRMPIVEPFTGASCSQTARSRTPPRQRRCNYRRRRRHRHRHRHHRCAVLSLDLLCRRSPRPELVHPLFRLSLLLFFGLLLCTAAVPVVSQGGASGKLAATPKHQAKHKEARPQAALSYMIMMFGATGR